MKRIIASLGPFSAASANSIATSQTPTAGVAFTLTANPVTVDATAGARRVVITAGSEASPRAVTLTGTDRTGSTRTEVIMVPASTAGTYGSALDYATVISMVSSTSFTAAVTVGTIATGTTGASDVASSAWVRLDDLGIGPVNFQIDVTNAGGSFAWTCDQSDDDANDTTVVGMISVPYITPAAMTWITPPDATFGGAAFSNGSTSKAGSMQARPAWLRLSCTAYTGNALATLTVSQAAGKLG